ncbi:ATP-binding protein [Natroniella acetigena]|uniref:AAA family ATPase n=1 Tax=Natroniella acetigena TaxID=52004 RepID=UPI00200B8C62|nr:AAA family ATPase [Natroniella acetigena]MCK8828514.1 ATP-binding protein [Natroniella acetigena]
MKKIATSKADFEEIINGGFIYVDKTKYLYNIVTQDTYYFLSRPRRFGKTLFISTLEAFFKGKKELFKDLYVYNQEWDWEEHPVIKLDFNTIPNENREVLEESISKRLNEIAHDYNINLDEDKPYYQFPKLIKKLAKKYDKKVSFLVDEYDKPIISNLGKGENGIEVAKENKEFLKILYDNLKALEKHLKLVFITGVSKFSKVSIFSTLNNLIELDMHPRFVTMLGYTEDELRNNFKNYFEELAKKSGIDIEELFVEIKMMYNGFRFGREDARVYNPFSIANVLDYQELNNYWFESGTPNFLVDLIKERKFDVSKLEKIEIGRDEIKAYDIERLQLIPLLFQTGYLTIKDIEDKIIYTLGYPNFEVEHGFNLNLIKSFSQEKIKIPIIHKIKKSLINNDYDSFIDYMKSLFSNISNINISSDVKEREDFYHTIFYLTSVLFSDNNLDVSSELLTSEGRIDMVVETAKNVFIIEFKCNQSADDAINQIKKRNYKDKYIIKEKDIVLIGINFSTEKRNISEVEIV